VSRVSRIGAAWMLVLLSSVAQGAPASSGAAPKVADERIILRTNLGDLVIALYPEVAPKHVAQLLKLTRLGVYDSTWFHRVEPGFVVQLGDAQNRKLPLSAAQRAAIKKLPAEFSALPHQMGTVSMARQDGDPNSAESSFSFLLANAPHLDGKYTVFGRLERGDDVLAAMAATPRDTHNRPLEDIVVRTALVKTVAEIQEMDASGELRKARDEHVVLRTNRGDLVLALYPDLAPRHVAQILKLVRLGVYDSTWFFRVQPGFLIQLSDAQNRRLPLSAEGRVAIEALPVETSDLLHTFGVATMAQRAGDPNSAETSFSLLLAPAPQLDGKFTAFGKVVWGHDVLAAIGAEPRDADNKPVEDILVQVAVVKTGIEIERMRVLGELRKAGKYAGAVVDVQAEASAHSMVVSVGIATMIALSLAGFFFSGRLAPERTSAFFILVILVGAFLLVREWVPRVRGHGIPATVLFFATVALFKLLNRFEAMPRSPSSVSTSDVRVKPPAPPVA
jgi:cyclophilin family peptidyl-prolyl cis-trans isomerase